MAKDSNKKEDLRALGFNPSIYFNSYAMGGDLEEGTPDLSAYETTYGELPPEVEHYMRMPGVNPDKVMAWFNLGINEPQTYNQAKLLAEAVGYNPEQAKVVAGQWQFESSGGARLSSPYNYFGIKSHNEAVRNKLAEQGINVSAGKEANTKEGAGTKTKSSFMEFNNAFEGFAAHRAFLETNQRYQKALASATAKDFAIGLEKAGYATAPNYGTKLYEDYVAPKENNPESGDTRPKSFGTTKSEKLKPSIFTAKPEVHVNQLPTLAPQMLEGFSPEISTEPSSSPGMYGSVPYETEVKETKPISMTAPKGWFGSGQSIFKQGGSMNFKSPGAYHKWLGYVHATGLAESTPGHQKVSIGGEPHKVQHQYGGHMYAQGGFNNPGFRALPTEVQNKIKSRSFAEGGSMDPLTEFNAGGSHEENPLGGIPQGTAPDGRTNLVEQGETKLNAANYIFSDKIKVDKDLAKELNLPKNYVGKTFAEVSKNINSRNGNSRREKGYDRIEDKARDTELETLMNAQELQKQMQMQADMQEMITKYPEEMGALLQGGAPGGQMEMSPEDQMAAQQDMAMQQGMEGQPSPEEMAMMQQQGGAPMDPAMMQQMAAPQGGGEIIPSSQLPMSYGGSMYMRGGKMCGYGGNMYDFGGFVDNNSAGLAGAGTGALSGASTGAMLGAATGPLAVIGAPVGAAIGGIVGGVSGFMAGHKKDKDSEEAKQVAQQQQLAQNNQINYAPQSPYITPAATNTMGTYAQGGPLYHEYPQINPDWKNHAGPMGQGLTNTQIYADGGELGDPPVSVGYYNNVPKRTDLMFQGNYFTTPEGNYPIPTSTSNRQTNKPIITEKGSKSVLGAPYADDYYRFKTYQADNRGKLRSAMNESYYTNNVGGERVLSVPNRYVTMDTLGYSQGRQSFPVRVVEKNIADGFGGSYAVNEFDATREQVPSLIKSMKNQTSQTNAEKVKVNADAVHKNALKVEANRRKVLKLAPLTDYEKQQILAGKEFAYGGSFDMPRQQMYMPLDNVERMGGHIYDGLSETSNYMSYVPQASSLLKNPWAKNNFTLGNYNTVDFTNSGSTGTTTNKSTGNYDVDTTLTDTTQDISNKGTAWDVIANAAPIAYNAYQAFSKPKSYSAKDFYTPMEAIRPDYTQAENEARYTYANLMNSIGASGLSGGNYASNAQNAANMRNRAMGEVAMAEENAFRQDQAHVRDINTSAYDKARAAAEQLNLASQTARQEHGKEALTGVKDWRNTQISNDLAMQYAALGAPDITRFKKFGYTPYIDVLREKYFKGK